MENTHISRLYKAFKWVVVITVCLDSGFIVLAAFLYWWGSEWGDTFDIEAGVRLAMTAQGLAWLALIYSIITITSGVLWFNGRRSLKYILLLSIALIIISLVNSLVQHYPYLTLRYFFSAISWRRIGWDLMLSLFHMIVFVLILIEPKKTPKTNLTDRSQHSVEDLSQPPECNTGDIPILTTQTVEKNKPPNLVSWIVSIILTIDGLGISLIMLFGLILALSTSHRNFDQDELFVVGYYVVIIIAGFLVSVAYFVACLKFLAKWRKGLSSGFVGTAILSILAISANIYLIVNSFPQSYWSSLDLIEVIRFHSIYFIPALANFVALCLIIVEKLRVQKLLRKEIPISPDNP